MDSNNHQLLMVARCKVKLRSLTRSYDASRLRRGSGLGPKVWLDIHMLFDVVAVPFPSWNAQKCVSFKIFREMCDPVLAHDCTLSLIVVTTSKRSAVKTTPPPRTGRPAILSARVWARRRLQIILLLSCLFLSVLLVVVQFSAAELIIYMQADGALYSPCNYNNHWVFGY